MTNKEWEKEADLYSQLLITQTSDVHFGVGIPGNQDLGLISSCSDRRRALDIGCGSGENAIALSSLGYDVLGVDASARQIQLATNRASQLANAPSFEVCPAESIRFLQGAFSLIISVGVLHFCSNLSGIMRIIQSKLESQGQLILSLPHPVDMISDYLELDADIDVRLSSYYPSGQLIRGSRYWRKFGGAKFTGYEFNEYVYTISDIINMTVDTGLRIDAFLEPICDHQDHYPCRFRAPSEHFVRYYSARVPQYAILIASKP